MKDFDKHIKQSLDNYGSPVDTDKLWKSLESTMDAPTKAPAKPWIIPLGIVTAIYLAAGLWYSVNSHTSDDSVQNTSTLLSENIISENDEQNAKATSVLNRKNITAVTDISAESATGNNLPSTESLDKAGNHSLVNSIITVATANKKSSSDETIKSSEKSSKNSMQKKKHEKSFIASNAIAKHYVNRSVKDPYTDQAYSESAASMNNDSQTNLTNSTVGTKYATRNTASSDSDKSYSRSIDQSNLQYYGLGGYSTKYTKNNYANPVMNADRATRSKNVDARQASASEARAYNKYKESLQRSRYYDLPKLPVIAASRSSFTRKGHRASDAFKIKLKRNDCPTFPARNAILFVDFGTGLSLSRKSFAASADMGLLSDLRGVSETPYIASQGRVNFGIKHKSGLAFMAGLSAYRITEKFDHLIITKSDSTFNDFGELLLVTNTEKDVEQKNSYSLYDIPLTIEYTRKTETRWSSGIQLGLIPNIALRTKGIILNPNETVVDIAENQSQVFKPRIGLSYFASVSANYLISDNYYLYFAPYARVMPESFTQSSYGIDQNYELWGANIGLRYYFGKGDF